MIFGYAHVSTGAQNLISQLAQLKTAGCEIAFREKIISATDGDPLAEKLMTKVVFGGADEEIMRIILEGDNVLHQTLSRI